MMAFPHTVDIGHNVNVRQKYGDARETPVTLYAGETAWVQEVSAGDAADYERRNLNVSHVVYFLRDLALTTEHWITHGSKTYEVVGFQEASAGLAVVWKALTLYRSEV